MGLPMLGAPPPLCTRCSDDQIVVSVGPYIFHSAAPPFMSSSARGRGRASPPVRRVMPGPPLQPASTRRLHREGVAWTKLIPSLSIRGANRDASIAVSRSKRTRQAPAGKGEKELKSRNVEGKSRKARNLGSCSETRLGLHREKKISEGTVTDRHALGLACRA